MMTMLAYRPFIDPMNFFHEWWWTLLPVFAFFISMSYKAVCVPTMDRFWREVIMMSVQIVVAMVALGVASFLLVEVLARAVVERV